jgi:hypothetical protein
MDTKEYYRPGFVWGIDIEQFVNEVCNTITLYGKDKEHVKEFIFDQFVYTMMDELDTLYEAEDLCLYVSSEKISATIIGTNKTRGFEKIHELAEKSRISINLRDDIKIKKYDPDDSEHSEHDHTIRCRFYEPDVKLHAVYEMKKGSESEYPTRLDTAVAELITTFCFQKRFVYSNKCHTRL